LPNIDDMTPRDPDTPNARASRRTARELPLMAEVRVRLAAERSTGARLRRLEAMERAAARVWVNGRELGGAPRFAHLSESYD
jgi:hypothetical protein